MQQALTSRPVRLVLSAFVALLVVTAGGPGVVAGAPAATHATTQADDPRPIEACGTIDEPGTYTLTENLTEAPSEGCLDVRADGVTIDGDGHTIVGNDTGVGVAASGAAFTLENVTLANWSTGVTVTGADATVRNSEISNGSVGVSVADGAVGALVAGGHVHNLSSVGVSLRGDDARVQDTTIDATGGAAIDATGSDEASLVGNEIRATGGGIAVTDAAGVTVRENALRDVDGPSIHVVGEGGDWRSSLPNDIPLYIAVALRTSTPPGPTTIVGNTVHDGSGNGIVVSDTESVGVSDNLVVRNRDGVRVVDSRAVSVVDNTALLNRDDGVSVAESPWSVVRNNTLRNNADDGVYVVADHTSLTGNLAAGNGDDGIDAQNSTAVTVRANVLTENRNDGVFFRTVDDGLIEGNEIRANADDGVDLRGTDRVTVANNTVCDSGDTNVIARTGAQNTTATNNGC